MSDRLPRILRPTGGAKPTVLLVDDHQVVLERVSSLLANDFNVAGVYTDGRQAIEAAASLAPDVIVLDINMPGLNGFETMRTLEESGSRAPIVFLSLIDDDDHVAEACRRGARGYVVKRQLVQDLSTALDQVLLGRRFAPSLTSLYHLAKDHGPAHAMQLYGDVPAFLDSLAAFVSTALQHGDATFIAATADLREGLEPRLRDRGWDVGGSSGHARCLMFDANDVLARVMRNGRPDPRLLAQLVAELDQFRRNVTADETTSRLTIFANTVVPLIASGNTEGAIALEEEWNVLTHDRPFFTMCGYATSCFHDDSAIRWTCACAEHWAVSQASEL